MAAFLKFPRGTRASLTALAGTAGLVAFAKYWVTDENRFVQATSTTVLVDLPRLGGTNTFTGAQTVPDDAYDATTWDANLTVPTKNAVRDKLNAMSTSALVFHLNGGGANIVANQKFDLPAIPFGATVTGWRITGDVSGTAVVDVLRATYANFPTFTSIAGSEKPSLTAVQKNEDQTLTTWTTALANGDAFRVNVDSITAGLKTLTVVVFITRT